jgi:signal transduction histidine kinase
MKTRTRARLILVITLVIFLIFLSYITQSVILQSFKTIEERETTAQVQRFISQLNGEIEDVAATCRDWAERDETAVIFSNPGGAQDPSRLFQPVSMKNLGIDYIAVYDASGKNILSATIAKNGETIQTVPPELDHIIRNSIVLEGIQGGVYGRRGISTIGKNPVVLAGYPVLYGNQTDTIEGTLIMARLLDDERMGTLNQMLQIDGTLEPYPGDSDSGRLSAIDEKSAKGGAIIVRILGDNELEGSALITGIENQPSFLLEKIKTTRPVHQQVQRSVLILAFSIIFLGVVFLLVVQLLLQRFVLAPMTELDNGMKTIGSSGDLSLRMPEKGDEEILSLTRNFNQMLEQVKQHQDKLQDFLTEIEQQRDDLSDARAALADRNRDLEELNRKANLYLDIYLDAITYEILNAVMGLRGYAELLKMHAVEDSEKKFASKIVALSEKSDNVIRNIETISRIYKNPAELKSVNLESIIRKETGSRPGAHIVVENCSRNVLANDMLGVVFDNLFSNCLKFGGKDTEIVVTGRDTPEGLLEIGVSDTGPGIPDSMKNLVFDRFMENTRKRSSYGLGLHIVKMLILSYGGTVRVEDRIKGDQASGALILFTLQLAEEPPGEII